MRLIVLGLMLSVLSGCATLGIGKPDKVTRWLADIRCVEAVTAAIGEIKGNPDVGGAKTVSDVMAVIATVGNSNVPSTVLAACKDTIAYLGEDAAAAAALFQNAPGTTMPKASPPRMATAPRPQPTSPQPVIIPIPRK